MKGFKKVVMEAGSVLLIAGIAFAVTWFLVKKGEYVTSTYSEYCYFTGTEHPSMKRKNKTYYKTLELCGKPLK